MPIQMPAGLLPEAVLPSLRQELQLLPNAESEKGGRQWLVFDPMRHLYFEVDERTAKVLGAWEDIEASKLSAKLADERGLDVSVGEIEDVLAFLGRNELLVARQSAQMLERAESRAQPLWKKLIHNYLFFRVPLVRPYAFFRRTLHLSDVFFSRSWWLFMAVLTVATAYLLLRQWSEFVTTFMHFFSLEGLLYYALALSLVKALHELGHGYAATRYGCKVPTMGLAFLVMMPVLYTDTTDSWKVRSRRERMIIDAAGVITELTIAVLASFAWAFLADGPLRSAMFFLATSSWLSSILVNTNPFMRFDGYHFLSDLTGVRNLQDRSFAVGRWRLREFLFKHGDPVPEPGGKTRIRLFFAYAWATWIYRFFLFLGIALLVYTFFFKALGVFLFLVEIYWFIARPIGKEMSAWRESFGDKPMTRRAWLNASMLCAALVAAAIPWQSRVTAPVMLEAAAHQKVFLEQSGKIAEVLVSNGQRVERGEVLLKIEDPDLGQELTKQELQRKLIAQRLHRSAASRDDRAYMLVLEQQLQEVISKIDAIKSKQLRNAVLAPAAGIVRDMNPQLHVGRWVDAGFPLAVVTEAGDARLRGYISAVDVPRITAGAQASFISEDGLRPVLQGQLVAVHTAATEEINLPALASVHGGRIAVTEQDGKLIPGKAWYPVELQLAGSASLADQTRSGVVLIDAEPQSLLGQAWQSVARVGVREMGI